MDGMLVRNHRISTGGRGQSIISNTIRLPRPTNVIAEISLATFDTASASYGTSITAYAVFTACTTDGSNPPLPPNEVFTSGSLSGPSKTVVIRNGLTSLTYEIDIENCLADFIINLFFWPFPLSRVP